MYSAVLSRRGPLAPERWSIVPFPVRTRGGGQHQGDIWIVTGFGPYATIEEALEQIPPEMREAALNQALRSD